MIESIDRALAILQLFLQEEAPLSLTQISKKMGMHKSTVSRTLDTLEGRDFVRRDGETGLYWLGHAQGVHLQAQPLSLIHI